MSILNSLKQTLLSPPTFTLFVAQAFVAIGLYTAFRLAFLVLYWPLFTDVGAGEILFRILHGVRFDLSVLARTLGLLWFVTFLLPKWLRNTKIWLVLSNLTAFLIVTASFFICFIDLFYYELIGRRLSFELFTIGNDLGSMGLLLVQDYLVSSLFSFALFLLLGLLWARVHQKLYEWENRVPTGIFWKVPQVFVILLLLVFVGRGGGQARPLKEGAAFLDANLELGHLTLNSPFTVLQNYIGLQSKRVLVLPEAVASKGTQNLLQQVETTSKFSNPSFPFYREVGQSVNFGKGKGKNVVVLLMEGWPAWATGAYGSTLGLTPNLDRWASQSRLYTNFMASGTRTVEGIAAVFGAIAPLPERAFLLSSAEQNRLTPLPQILVKEGYDTLFVHGAFNGSMGIHEFAKKQGYLSVLADDDISLEPSSKDGTWGTWDHIALNHLLEELDQKKAPFFAGFFSVSLHEPFVIPEPSKILHSKTDKEKAWQDVLSYTDQALGKFLDDAKTRPWFKDTIFVITADHQMSGTPPTRLEKSRIPLLILDPSKQIQPGVDPKLGSQVDLMTTLADYLGVKQPTSFMGANLFASDENRFALFSSSGLWWFEGEYVEHYMDSKHIGSYNWKKDEGMTTPLVKDAAQAKRAERFFSYYQSVQSAILDNKIAPSPFLQKGEQH